MSASSVLDRPGEPVSAPVPSVGEARFDEICDELAELCGQRNAIDGRIAELVGEVSEFEDELLGGTGLRSVEHFCTWQLGVSSGRAKDLTAIAQPNRRAARDGGVAAGGVVVGGPGGGHRSPRLGRERRSLRRAGQDGVGVPAAAGVAGRSQA